jgi:ELWxxDGT repeat protein
MRHTRNTRRLSMQTLESRQFLDASSQVLVDLSYRAGVNESASSDQGIFFVRDDARYGTELWATNQTGTDPRLVVDLTPGELGSSISSITAVDGGVYFVNLVSGSRNQLWWSDGTASNTRMVADDIITVYRLFAPGSTTPLANDGSHVYFMQLTNTTGQSPYSGLWAASAEGRVVQQLTDQDFLVDDDLRAAEIESFKVTKSGLSVFVLSAYSASDFFSTKRRFLCVTDGTREGTKVSDFATQPSSFISEAVTWSDDKILIIEGTEYYNADSRLLTIDRQGSVELLREGFRYPVSGIESSSVLGIAKSGSKAFFSADNNSLISTDGTVDGTQVVESAGRINWKPVTLSDGSLLTLANRQFQVTDPETLATTKLDFIVPSDLNGSGELYGSIVVGEDKFFYVETTGSNARRLMMADTRARTVTTVLQGNPNEAIGAQYLKGDNLFFTYVTPTRTDLIQYNTNSGTSFTLASVVTNGWQGLSIDTVGEDLLIGFMQTVDNASIFKLRLAESKLDIVSLVDETLSTGDLFSDGIRNRERGRLMKFDDKTIAFLTHVEINGQVALPQVFAYDTSASGLTRLVSPSLPQPSNLKFGLYNNLDPEQSVFRAGGKIVYHAGHRVFRSNGSIWDELWSTEDGKSGQKLLEIQRTGDGYRNLIPMGVIEDRFYFLSTGPSTTLYRTNGDATAVEVVADTPWGNELLANYNFQVLYRPRNAEDRQRILFRRMGNATEQGIWEIAGNPPTLTKIVEQSVVLGSCNQPSGYVYTCAPKMSAGAMSLNGTESHGPLVEVSLTGNSTDRMVPFFGENSSLSFSEQQTARLYRLNGAWVGVVPGLNQTYSFWSRRDDSTGATRVSDIDLSAFAVENVPVHLLDLALTADAVVFISGSKVIRLDLDGTHSFVDVPPPANSREFYHVAALLDRRLYSGDIGLQGEAFLRVGGYTYTDRIYTLTEDARSVREVFVAGDKHYVAFQQVDDGVSQYVLTDAFPSLHRGGITRNLQNAQALELPIDQPESTLLLAMDRVVVHSGEQTAYDGAASALHSLDVHSEKTEAIVTVDIGTMTQSSKFPRGGISITLAERSILRLVGTALLPVTYRIDDDELTISSGELTIRVLNPNGVTIDDQIVARERDWSFSTGNDDVEIRPSGTNQTEFVERTKSIVIRVVAPTSGEGTSSSADLSRWRIDMKTGIDKLTVDPSVSAVALLSIVSDLDRNSDLKLNLPTVSAPLDVTRQSGRTFASVPVGGLHVQLDNSRRPQHNLANAIDANNDGKTNALDALRIINTISRRRRIGESATDVVFGDVNGDGRVTALDALLVINSLARQARNVQFIGETEGIRKKV